MPIHGYYRFPDVHDDFVIFTSEGDLWRVPLKGGRALRLTANKGVAACAKISPDGRTVAFISAEEGVPEVSVMDSEGGLMRRITFFGSWATPLGWSSDGKEIIINSNFETTFNANVYRVPLSGGEPILVPVGPATAISFGKKGTVIGRHTRDGARWKRYRGGTAGELWIDTEGKGDFSKLLNFPSNFDTPMWIGDRIYFLSDHEGIGNIYSCTPAGKDVKRHTHHADFYARNPSTDGRTIVYHSSGDLYALDVKTNKNWKIEIDYHSSRTHTNRKFVDATKYLQGFDLHPNGTHIATAVRGRFCTFANWTGPVQFHGKKDGIRYRMPTFLHDGENLVAVSDEMDGEDRLLVVNRVTGKETLLKGVKPGRIHQIAPSPKAARVAITNHRNEVYVVDIDKKTMKLIDSSDDSRIGSPAWSPDGRWLTYTWAGTPQTESLRIAEVETGITHDITEPQSYDGDPVFSPDGKYLYYVGNRVFDPVYDALRFDIGFVQARMLYAIPLKADTPSPFIPKVKSPSGDEDRANPETPKESDDKEKKADEKKELVVEIDFEGIKRRSLPFPIKTGTYFGLMAYESKVYYLDYPRDGRNEDNDIPKPRNTLWVFDFDKLTTEVLMGGITDVRLSLKGGNMIVRRNGALSVYKTGDKPKEKVDVRFSLQGGDIDMARIRTEINPVDEWKQMYREAWLLQREHFWIPDMGGVDWNLIYKRYLPLLERVGTRGEFSDLIWEMQGELGTSHCYEFGGDYTSPPNYPLGKLGCTYGLKKEGWYFKEIYYGDSTVENEISPLLMPGINLKPGDLLLAVNGQKLDATMDPRSLLINLPKQEVTLTVKRQGAKKQEDVIVKTLAGEFRLQYRQWVENNRAYVHEKSQGRLGYLHIPNMGADGYAEFFRNFLRESAYEGLIVDVRYNGGGHVSQLLLEQLNKKIIGYSCTRWSKVPEPYPHNGVPGPIVAITNEHAGSDGDIFSHSFKLMKLGKLVGKRTWGGVIGINGQYSLADGAITTQPEYSYWFKDVGWGVENYGTDPDVDVEILPKDHVKGRDPQMDKALEIAMADLKKLKVEKPDVSKHPNRALPKLPKAGK
jgi:tricorn protease